MIDNIMKLPLALGLLSISFFSASQDSVVQYLDDSYGVFDENPTIVSVGIGANKIKAGEAVGAYFAFLLPVMDSRWGVYGRAELISDEYKTGHFWSWNTAVGIGYYWKNDVIPVLDNVIPVLTVGKCFSNYSTCYFNNRHPTQNDDDIDAVYYGGGVYIDDPFWNGAWEIMVDWSPYKSYNGRGLYLGYGFKF